MSSLLLAFLLAQAPAPLTIDGPQQVAPYRLVELRAVGNLTDCALIWDVSPEEVADTRELPGGTLLLVGPPGVYKVKLRAIRLREGNFTAETARFTLTIGTPAPPTPPTATVQLRIAGSSCTATIIAPRRNDGKWDILTAAHCTGPVGSAARITLKDGRTLAATVTVRDTTADLAWLSTDASELTDLPAARLAANDPTAGVRIWHAGYGVDRPGNRMEGTLLGGPDAAGQLRLRLSVSPGDSGSGIFRVDNGELVAVVCCTLIPGSHSTVWGGAASTARRLRR